MARITLQPASILQCIPLLLPQGTAAPRSAPDALAALIHAINTALQLQLVAVEESSTSTSSSTNQSPSEDNVLPASWNARSPDFTLKYREPESNQILLVKILKLGNKSQIHGILEQKEETSSLDIITNEYVSPTFFSATDEQERATSDLVHGYVSSDRMAELITKYIKDVLRPLLPDLNYEPREDSSSSLPPSEERPERPRLRDENQTQPPPLHQPYSLPNRQDNPLEVGRSDLDPFANPFAGKSPLQPLVPGGGMYVGPGHPMFGPRGGAGIGGQPGRSGPWGGDGYLPPLGAPPGARFDPVGPLQGIGGGIGRLPGPGGRGPNPRGGPFSGDPDNDEFMPPGRGGPGNFPDDMYM